MPGPTTSAGAWASAIRRGPDGGEREIDSLRAADEHGFTLTLANARRFGGEPPRYPEAFHVGFVLDSPADVDAAYARLAAANVALDRAPGRQHGNYGFYFTALNGILFEVQCLSRSEAD